MQRIERVPAHHLLWFEWGNAEAPVTHDTTLLGFARTSDPVFTALSDSLERASIMRGESFVVRPAGTREERMGPPALYTRLRPGSFSDRLHRGPQRWRRAR